MVRFSLPFRPLVTCLAPIALMATAGFSQDTTDDEPAKPEPPALPRQVKSLEALVPADWVVLAEAKGDLNQDAKDDAVVILTHSDTSYENPQHQRILVVLLATDTGYEVSAVSPTAVLSRFSGGVLGDPFQELRIERGTFVIVHYGGSRHRWGFTNRFRFQDEDWFLIGRTTETHDTLSQEATEKDENLITGRVIEVTVNADGKRTKTDTTGKPDPLIPLSKIDVEAE